jgi:hypothetical protein
MEEAALLSISKAAANTPTSSPESVEELRRLVSDALVRANLSRLPYQYNGLW